ncbi:MAG: cytochrome c [Gemmatimonadetes bacterium]|nr:cytochrome c [Gemmatimonadota bacterium]
MNVTTIRKTLGYPVALLAVSAALLAPAGAAAQQDAVTIGEGAQVYAATCARCHNARPSSERTDLEWIPIVQHMRARANMTKRQADAVLAFLQATNAPEPSGSVQQSPASSTPTPTTKDGASASQAGRVLPAELQAALLPDWAWVFVARLERRVPDQTDGE